MSFENQKGNRRIFGTLRGEQKNFCTLRGKQKNFTDPIKKNLKSQNINLYQKNVT